MTISAFPDKLHYEFISPQQDDEEANVCFSGSFEGKTVSWHATIMTLHRYYNKYNQDPYISDDARQFIDISPGNSPEHFHLTVTLAVDRIDHPTILKTIIMIRNYKRLALGRHEYGTSPRRE